MKKREEWNSQEVIDQMERDKKIVAAYFAKIDSSRSRKIDFQLTLDDYIKLRKKKKCYYTGVVLDEEHPGAPNGFTLDRIDSTKGYTYENTVPCANKVNQIKAVFEKDFEMAQQIIKKITKPKTK